MSANTCPIAYDHNDDLDECAVCGWRPEDDVKPIVPDSQRERTYQRHPWLLPEGSFAPSRPVTLCDRRAASSAAPSNDDAARDMLAAVRSLVESATDPRVALADIAALLKASDQ